VPVNRKGFSSLYIIMILSSLAFLILVLIEGASGFALRSRAEGICMLAGESILSEYQRSLWGRYGIFAVRASNERLTALADFYIEGNLAVEGDNILRMTKVSCRADSQEYPGLDGEQFAVQIRQAAAFLAAEDLLFDAQSESICSDVREALTWSEARRSTAEEEIRHTEEGPSDSGSPDGSGEEEQAEEVAAMRSLLKRYREADEPRENGNVRQKALPCDGAADGLPTRLLGIPSQKMLLSSSVLPHPFALPENEYILAKCSYATCLLESCALDLEAEYVLFGLPSDSENEQEVRNSLFWLRSALNLSHIYADSGKKAQVSALAASVLTLIPLPVAEFIVAGIWAAVEARNDVELLFDGEVVPFVKTAADWASGLDGALSRDAVPRGAREPSSGIGTYKDYLRLLLLMVPADRKRARLMDVMQLNIAGPEGDPFNFRAYAYGFTLEASFDKRMRLPGYWAGHSRKGSVRQEHVYR